METPASSSGGPQRALQRSPRQQAILSLIADSPAAISTSDLARITGQTLGATAHHVRALARHGLIEVAGIERVRGAIKTFYAATEVGREALLRPRVETLIVLVGAVTPKGSMTAAVAAFDDAAYDEAHELLRELRPALVAIGERAQLRAQGEDASAA